MNYITNPDLIILPRRPENDNSPGGFTILNPRNKRRFLLPSGPDGHKLIEILLFFSVSKRNLLKYQDAHSLKATFQSLIEAALLIPMEIGVTYKNSSTYMPVSYAVDYQNIVFNYPFGDYKFEKTILGEMELMNSYSKDYPPPKSYFVRPGAKFYLPQIKSTANKLCSSLIGNLAYILKHTFGALASFDAPHGQFFHKTSPSGGARHPCEAVLLLTESVESIPAGIFSYDFIEHCLISSEPLGVGEKIT